MDNAETPQFRKIIHVDADAFFASVEQRDDPSLRGKPVAVGGSRERGVVAAASYEARKFGIRSAMPSITARKRCPQLIFVPPRFEVYRDVSRQIREIFLDYTNLVEPLSLDEAYLDVTENSRNNPVATEIAAEIRARVRAETDLTVSAGVSYCKFLAKMASDERKPDGLFVITPKNGPRYMERLAVSKFHGVGPATAERMHSLGIVTGADLRSHTEAFLRQHFGKAGTYFYNLARGVDERPVVPDRIRKSIGAERTFEVDLDEAADIEAALSRVVAETWTRCLRHEAQGRTVTVKVKFSDFEQITRSRSCDGYVTDQDAMQSIAISLVRQAYPLRSGVRLLGVTLSNLAGDEEASPPAADGQLSLL
ncbi:DNA polymerase IV [Agrobacterium rubi]|nr:DNA polymerase IV [Agrobacterium rubi]NTF24284.1 DNA polymerase IV [Agrobacterium rubi]